MAEKYAGMFFMRREEIFPTRLYMGVQMKYVSRLTDGPVRE